MVKDTHDLVISLIKLTFVVIPNIIGCLVEPDVVSVEQPTIRETEAFGLLRSNFYHYAQV